MHKTCLCVDIIIFGPLDVLCRFPMRLYFIYILLLWVTDIKCNLKSKEIVVANFKLWFFKML